MTLLIFIAGGMVGASIAVVVMSLFKVGGRYG